MSEPTMHRVAAGYLVVCPTHDLRRIVKTERHATNLLALHLRIDHTADLPLTEVHLSAGAAVLIEALEDTRGRNARVLLEVWRALVGADTHAEARAQAERLVLAAGDVTAVVPPF